MAFQELDTLLHNPTVIAALIGAGVSSVTFFVLMSRELQKIKNENLIPSKIKSYNEFIDTCTEYNFYKQLEIECCEKKLSEELRITLEKEVLKIHLYGKKALVDSAWKIVDYLTKKEIAEQGNSSNFSDVICEFVALAREDLNLDKDAFNKNIYSTSNIREVQDCCGIPRTGSEGPEKQPSMRPNARI
jgi:hypothetical protein